MRTLGTLKLAVTSAILVMAVLQARAAFADSSVATDIQNYTQYFKTNMNLNVSVSVQDQNREAIRQLEQLDLFMEKKIQLNDKSLRSLRCTQPVCGGDSAQ